MVLADAGQKKAGCTNIQHHDGSGTEIDSYYCPERFLPGHRTDNIVINEHTPQRHYRKYVHREYHPSYYRTPRYYNPYRYRRCHNNSTVYYYPTYNPLEPIYWIQ